MQHLYRVATPYTSVGTDGVKEFKVGDEITLDRPSTSRHLELISTGTPEPARDLAAELKDALAAKDQADKDLATLREQNDQGGRALQEALDANAKLQADLAAAVKDAEAQRTLATDLRGKLDDAEKAATAAAKASQKKA